MGGIRLRTKFLLSMVAVSAALTFTTLLVVRHTVQQQVRLGIQRDLQNSVSAFHNLQKQREVTLERSAALLADLPNVRALMTTHDAATIQDASRDLWQLAGSDMLLLADSSGKVMALQSTPQEITVRHGQDFFTHVVLREQTRHWWYVEGHLYEVFLQDIYFGPASGRQVLGYLLLGYEIDDRVARDLSRVAASEVAFRYGDSIVRSTLKPAQESELLRVAPRAAAGADGGAGGEPAGFSDLAYVHASAGESGGGGARTGAGGLCVSAAGARRRRSCRGNRNLRPDEKEPAENAQRVAGCGTAGDDWADGEFDLARSAAFSGGCHGERGISL